MKKQAKKKIKEGDIIAIVWYDSYGPSVTGWMSADEVAEFKANPLEIVSVGFFEGGTKDHVCISQSLCKKENDEHENRSHVLNIPKGCIKSIKTI